MVNRLMDSAVFLALVIAYLYAASNAQYNGYLNAYDLNGDILDRNFHQVIYNGFIIMLLPFTWLAIGYFLWRVIVARVIFRGYQYFFIDENNPNPEHTGVIWSIVILTLWAVCFAALYADEKRGREQGEQEILELQKKNNLISVTIENEKKKLVLITCGAKNCAGIDKYSQEIYYFPQTNFSYQLKLKEK